jgi:hypothetical protein
MAFGGPAIFSNDPNIGIRKMGMEAFIPAPVNSMTFKGRAGVDARRRGNYQNAPTGRSSAPPHKVVTNPDGTQMSVLLDGKKKGKDKTPASYSPPLMATGLEGILDRAFRFGYGRSPAAAPKPTVRVPTAAEIADGITRLEERIKKDKAHRWLFGEKDPMEDVGATDLPSTMFRGGAMFA